MLLSPIPGQPKKKAVAPSPATAEAEGAGFMALYSQKKAGV